MKLVFPLARGQEKKNYCLKVLGMYWHPHAGLDGKGVRLHSHTSVLAMFKIHVRNIAPLKYSVLLYLIMVHSFSTLFITIFAITFNKYNQPFTFNKYNQPFTFQYKSVKRYKKEKNNYC